MNEVLELLDYDQDTGIFFWSEDISISIKAGSVAGHIRKDDGYVNITCNNRCYKAHRLAYAAVTGTEPTPTQLITHIDGNRSNNAWKNLKVVDRQTLCRTATIQSRNTSGYKGISYNKSKKKYQVRISIGNGLEKLIGYFSDLNSAIISRKKAELKYW